MNQGPSAMGMYNAASSGDISTGEDHGRRLLNQELDAQRQFATPSKSGPVRLMNPDERYTGALRGQTVQDVVNKENYNLNEDQPVKRHLPSAWQQRFQDSSERQAPR